MWLQEETVFTYELHFLQHISLNCGNNKEFIATKEANMATGTF
jgi:hypothetical protein